MSVYFDKDRRSRYSFVVLNSISISFFQSIQTKDLFVSHQYWKQELSILISLYTSPCPLPWAQYSQLHSKIVTEPLKSAVLININIAKTVLSKSVIYFLYRNMRDVSVQRHTCLFQSSPFLLIVENHVWIPLTSEHSPNDYLFSTDVESSNLFNGNITCIKDQWIDLYPQSVRDIIDDHHHISKSRTLSGIISYQKWIPISSTRTRISLIKTYEDATSWKQNALNGLIRYRSEEAWNPHCSLFRKKNPASVLQQQCPEIGDLQAVLAHEREGACNWMQDYIRHIL